MVELKLEFDFETILEASGVQVQDVKTALRTKTESGEDFQEKFATLKELKQGLGKKIIDLHEKKLSQKECLKKEEFVNEIIKKFNKKNTNLLQENANLNVEIKLVSDDLTKKVLEMDEERKVLASKFEDKTLIGLIEEKFSNISLYEDALKQLRDNFEKAKKKLELEEYERLDERIFNRKKSVVRKTEYEYFMFKIGKIEENIQVLTNACNKMKQFK